MIMQSGRALAVGSPAELARSTLASTRTVDIDVSAEHRELALKILREARVEDVEVADEGLIVRVDGREAIAAIVSVLARADVPIYRIAEREPDLEAAYFALHAENGAK
jgi:ABC-type multidrug transport system ATPase subunit